MKSLYILIFCSLLGLASCRKGDGNLLENKVHIMLPPEGYKLVWSDEFDGKSLDLTKWMHRAPGQRRDGFNSPEAVYIDTATNNLVISTFVRNDTAFTGMIATRDRYHATYGYFECRAKVSHIFPGYWTAFWIQSKDIGKTLDPGESGMEIDVMEFIAGDPFQVNHALHWNGYGQHQISKSQNTFSQNSFLGDYHIYALEWTSELYRFYIDGRLVWEVNEPISHKDQYVILSAEVSSKAALIDELNKGRDIFFEVDYVRIYQK